MAEVSASQTVQQIVLERQRVTSIQDSVSRRITENRRLEDRENLQDYLDERDLENRISQLLADRAEISEAIDVLAATQAGLDAAERLGDQLRGLAFAAQTAESATEREALAAQFDTVRTQLDNLVGDTSVNGVNLLDSPPDQVTATTVTVQGEDTTPDALGIGTAAADFNGFATQADIDAAIAAVDAAISTIQATDSRIGINAAILSVRDEFSQDLVEVAQVGADRIRDADPAEDAAVLLATRTRDALSAEGLQIAAQSERQIVDLVADAVPNPSGF